MNIYVRSDLPTIYADINVYRYVVYGELQIKNPERFRWVYSHVHLDEMVRGGNTDALEGMRILKAVEIDDVLNDKFESSGNVILREYLDPDERYQRHLEAISRSEDSGDLMIEYLLRFFGADNYEELSLTPELLRDEINRLTSDVDAELRDELVERAENASADMKETMNEHLKERRSLDQSRLEMGLTSSARADAARSDSPIDAFWEIIGPSMGGIPKDQFFGFEPNPAVQGVQHTQHGALSSAHIVLNMLGLSPDKGLAKRDKIRNIMSDGQHVGMASYCNSLLSADKRFCDKANAIYIHTGSITRALWFQHNSKGSVLRLGITETAP